MGGRNQNKRHITDNLENINLELAHTLYIVGMSRLRRSN